MSADNPHRGHPAPPVPAPNPPRGRGRGSRGGARQQRRVQQDPTVITPPPSETSQPNKFTIIWSIDQMDTLAAWLKSHAADCNILFSQNKADHPENLEKPSGKDKTAICAVVAQLIFGQDPEWQDRFVSMPKKFTISVTNCISYLRKTFVSHYRSLHQTGEGVQAGVDAANIHVAILKDFPWYDDLYAIWNGIPNFTAKLTNSQPGKSCSVDFLKLIAPAKKTVPVNQQTPSPAAQVVHATDGTPHPAAVPPDEDINMWDGDELDEGVGMDEEEVVPSKVVNQGGAQKGKRKAVEPLDSLGPDFDFDFDDPPEEEQVSNYHTREAGFQLMATKASITGQQSHQPLAFPTPSPHSSTPFRDARPSASRASSQASGSRNRIISPILSGAMSNSSGDSKAGQDAAIHTQAMENKEAEIRLEEAKARAAIETMKVKQAEAEVLRLSLMMKGIMPDANVPP
ncbi:hypothetical protein HD554DRAFT_2331143 [Boletus coccyginus]|nr:hypothetical protein HD554DRAFT_2331143 [Boletus coccyginus]